MTSSTTTPEKANNNTDPCVQMTDVTIETNIDPHDETTTTTTTVHLPFQIARQCPPPKVISWMKSRKPAATATATIRSSNNKKQSSSSSSRPHHHHHNSRHNRTVGKVQQLLPFLNNRRRSNNAADKSKKGDQAITVFSIQVNILGKVLVPPCPSTVSQAATASSSSASILQKSSLSSNASSASIATPEENDSAAADLAPVKTLPAQLNKSATTSYVIHRTFEDFQRLSDMVLNLQDALMTAPGSIPQGPVLTALAVRHPHAGLYQALLKQFSQAKANQRAFDASSTTHGFNEEGAFERVLELNQYLEDVWFWLLPENTPESLNLSVERHDIMQWLKPSASSSHADGRQMRERSDQPLTTNTRPVPQIAATTIAPPVVAAAPEHDLSVFRETDKVQDEDHDQQQHQQEDRATRAPERMSSVSSIPSLSSSSSFSVSSTTSMTTMSEAGGNDLREEEKRNNNRLHQGLDGSSSGDIHHLEVVMQGSPHTLSTMAGSTLAASSDVLDTMGNSQLQHASDAAAPPTPAVTIETPGSLPSFSRHGTLQRRHLHRNSHMGPESSASAADVKLKRRMSLSQVFKSLTLPISASHNNNHRHSQYDAGTSREVFDEDIYIWNTVTTKNLPKPTIVA
ncbi:hypothetical protein BGZ95_000841 [Linnemannia exigua]|uniref:Uncharacterized protein n=1 Tax=Linnemannia exigua TaxID=604196 RepID=A0AAD4D7Q9_9FUNG|nr:hypothetical protein BGZ95_000841 [Linnemannia exigua]